MTFFVSLLVHAVILCKNPNLIPFLPEKKTQSLEVSYLKQTPQQQAREKEGQAKKEQLIRQQSKIELKKIAPPPFAEKEDILRINRQLKPQGLAMQKPDLVKPEIMAARKRVTLPPLDVDKINNPTYISYYHIVREKIRRAAYQGYTHAETGEVYLSFIVSNDGALREVQLVDAHSTASEYLRQTALASIREASPFPRFPGELDYPQLSFNVVISFEIE